MDTRDTLKPSSMPNSSESGDLSTQLEPQPSEAASPSIEDTKEDTKQKDATQKYSPGWLRTVRFLSWVAYNYHRLEVQGIEHIPPKGEGAILCANHPGLLDPGFIHLAVLKYTNRWMRWLGWAGLVNSSNKFVKWIVRNVGTMVPVEEHEGKATNKASVHRAFDILAKELNENHLVGLFPEGLNHTFGDYNQPYPFRTGAVRLAAQNRVPIIPLGIYGPHRVWVSFGEIKTRHFHMWLTLPFWFPAKVYVRFGEPMYLDERLYENPEDYDLIRSETERLQKEVYALAHALED